GGRRAGFAEENTGRVVTRFGGPESVLAHEIGHQLDWKYGLSDELAKVKGAGAELRALADLRYEGEDAPASFKKYVRQAPEKMAALVEAYVHAPERLKEVAPNTFQWFSDFIHFHP